MRANKYSLIKVLHMYNIYNVNCAKKNSQRMHGFDSVIISFKVRIVSLTNSKLFIQLIPQFPCRLTHLKFYIIIICITLMRPTGLSPKAPWFYTMLQLPTIGIKLTVDVVGLKRAKKDFFFILFFWSWPLRVGWGRS